MLELKKVSKSYTQRGMVLGDLDLVVRDGDAIAVTGPSGSGKTTLINIIGTLDHPDSGDVIFRGRSVSTLDADESASYRNRNIGFVFQDHLLLPHLTVGENILLPLFASDIGLSEYEEKKKNASGLMKRIGISPLAGKYPFQISGGEAQRATLVRALINKPSLLLADEPTGSLDAENARILGDLLVEINRETGLTLLIVTHSDALASRMKTHLILENGKLKTI
ncbi:MAG TPA: ABC transporter ATP-binding protein [Bacteroidales bacterium]|jgi:ABC-type lipoprotein export system ATPase subunit|nr:ABC transporter ATP-binding protein [Bacteroidales bacterium]HOS72592.1 ABC transporter ATP-binding protein [Bacteroidales bacterium]HQH23349.1 ABC transporter ATP-binding protein [Bacteroidales bacterium]HQJ81406.1 ABC transporter ATP-binding protein [Bacteroidales bacterium]